MNPLPEKPSPVSRKTVWLIVAVFLVIGIGCLGLASLMTTFGMWDGMFPSGEYHLKIQDESGRPIPGATLRIYEGETKNPAFEYPIDNHFSEGDLISDEHGMIVALHKPRGLEFGGGVWYLFWMFPMYSDGPEFDFQISADGYQTIKFTTEDLFEPDYNDHSSGNTTVVLDNGENAQIPVYELIFTLEK